MSLLSKNPVHFFTSLGNDQAGRESYERLKKLGLKLYVSWREKPTRKGISFVDSRGERAITVIGERLQPESKDNLPWNLLNNFDGVFITATDSKGIERCKGAKTIVATPRLKSENLNNANLVLDALIGSSLDPYEELEMKKLTQQPKFLIKTQGERGGTITPGGNYEAIKISAPTKDSYGCGDSFAAGVTVGLAAGWSIEKAVNLGAKCGAICATCFGPYNKEKSRE